MEGAVIHLECKKAASCRVSRIDVPPQAGSAELRLGVQPGGLLDGLVQRGDPVNRRAVDGAAALTQLAEAHATVPGLGPLAAELLDAVGPDGWVQVEVHDADRLERRYQDGSLWRARPAWRSVMPSDHPDLVLVQPAVVVADLELTTADAMRPILETIRALPERPLLLVARKVADGARQLVELNNARGTTACVPVVLSTPRTHQSADFADVATLTGAEPLSSLLGRPPGRIRPRFRPVGSAPAVPATALGANAAGTLLVTGRDGVARSVDHGRTWSDAELPARAVALCQATDGRQWWLGTTDGLLHSDNALQWQSLGSPPVHDLRAIAVGGDQLTVWGSSCGAVSASTGWVPLPDCPGPLTRLAIAPDGAHLAVSPSGLSRLPPGGRSWEHVVAAPEGVVANLGFDGTDGWAVPVRNAERMLSTQDSGRTWQVRNGPPSALPVAAFQPLADGPLLAAHYDMRRRSAQLWLGDRSGSGWSHLAEAEVEWPIVNALREPGLLTLGCSVFELTDSSLGYHLVRQTTLDDPIVRLVGNRNLRIAMTTSSLWRTHEGDDWQRIAVPFDISEVCDVAVWRGSLLALLTGGRLWSGKP